MSRTLITFGKWSIVVLLLASCKAGPNYERPEVESPKTFQNTNVPLDSAISLKWWEIFKDPTLDTLISHSLKNNKNLLATYQRMEATRSELAVQKANLWPKLDLRGNAASGNYFGGAFNPSNTIQNYFIGGSISWELDFWGKIRRMNESAKAKYLGSEFGYRAMQISLISEVATTYFTLLEYNARLNIAKETVALRDSSLGIIQSRYNSGIIPEIDLNQAQIQYAIAASSIPQYERQVKFLEHALSVLVGELPHSFELKSTLDDQDTTLDIPTGIPAELISRRPDVRVAEQQLIAQNAMIGVAQAKRLPSISLTGILGVTGNELSNLGASGAAWSVGGNLLSPIFYFGQLKRQVDAERFKTQGAVYEYEQAVLKAFMEVENALVEIESYQKEMKARKLHVEASLNAQNLSQQRYDKGVTSYLEYLESQRQAFEAQIALVYLKQKYLSSYVNLYKSLGGGWINEKEFNKSKNNPQNQ